MNQKIDTMKKLIYIAFISAATLTACSDDFLERPPLNSVSEDTFWQSEEDVYLAVNALYADLPADGLIYEDGATDIAHAQNPWESTATDVSSGVVNTTLDAGWSYIDKRKANYFLDNVDKAEMSETLKERYKAEVRFIRAFSYFRMVSKFGDVPLVTSELGFSEEELNIPRTPEEEVYAFILAELEEVAEVLPTSYSGGKPNEVGRITKGAALALKARVHLYIQQFEEAAHAAQEVMELGYELFTVNEELDVDKEDDYSQFIDFTDSQQEQEFRLALRSYEGLFHEANNGNKEVILDRQFIKQEQPNSLNTLLIEGGEGGWSSVTPTQNLVDAYQSFLTGEDITPDSKEARAENYSKEDKTDFVKEFKNRDPRFYATVLFETAPWNALTKAGDYTFAWKEGGNNMSRTGYNFRKLVDPKANVDNLDSYTNMVILRYAEVLLTYAEAKNEVSGPDNSIYDAIDQIRKRVGMPVLDRNKVSTKEQLREAIRKERMVELALEGQRYMDIRRWETAPEVMTDIYSISNSRIQQRVWNDKLYLMPVPQNQIDLSYGVLEQNPGY